MPDYSKSKIYKIICSETQKIYIGSTIQPLSKRLYGHKHKKNKCKSNTFIEPKIYLVETVCCDSKEELHARERYHIENIDCVNKCIPGRTHKEYCEKNKEKRKELYKKYREENKDIISKKSKVKYTCECGSTLRKADIRPHERTKKHQAFISQSK